MIPATAWVLTLIMFWNGQPAMTTIPGEFFEQAACETAATRWRSLGRMRNAEAYCLQVDGFYGSVQQLMKNKDNKDGKDK